MIGTCTCYAGPVSFPVLFPTMAGGDLNYSTEGSHVLRDEHCSVKYAVGTMQAIQLCMSPFSDITVTCIWQ